CAGVLAHRSAEEKDPFPDGTAVYAFGAAGPIISPWYGSQDSSTAGGYFLGLHFTWDDLIQVWGAEVEPISWPPTSGKKGPIRAFRTLRAAMKANATLMTKIYNDSEEREDAADSFILGPATDPPRFRYYTRDSVWQCPHCEEC